MGVGSRSYQPGGFLLELDGKSAGYLRGVEGGGAVADVVQEMGVGHASRKHIGNVHYDDLVLDCDAGAAKAFYEWTSQASQGHAGRKGGAVDVVSGGTVATRLEWQNGLVAGIYFPALDAAGSEAFHLTVKIQPETTRVSKGGGTAAAVVARKSSQSSGFHLKIDGLEDACAHVSRIEPISVDQKSTRVAVGTMRDYEVEPTNLDPGNLVVTLPEANAAGFYSWFDDFVIKGNNRPDKEKRGSLEVGPFSLEFGNLGVYGIARPSAGAEKAIRKIKVEMYCESITFRATV